MSLATKCQLLFGAAVFVIIVAALLVPWQRMEQLTADLNERAAEVATRLAAARHAAEATAEAPALTMAAAAGGGALWTEVLPIAPDAAGLDDFERQAAATFAGDDPAPFVFVRYATDFGPRFRYARPLPLTADCRACHAAPMLPVTPTAVPALAAALGPPPFGMVAVDMASQVSRRQQMLNRALLVSGLVLAATLATVTLWFILSRLILRPVRVLQDAAEQVASGDTAVRSHIGSGDEFEQLSDTFNQMLANLNEQEEALRSANKSLDARLNQLAQTNVALDESNRLKSEFLANVSHELRTPLNSILGFADLLKSAAGEGNEKVQRYLKNITTSGRGLLELINDLLDLAKIESGRMEVRLGPVSVADLFEGLEGTLRPLTAPRALRVVTHVDADVPILRTDPGKLQQVLYNLMSNAIKFSPDGGRIDLTAERSADGGVRLGVADQGPGIAAGQQEIIFEKFRQLDQGHTRTHGGTGLGLAISRELVALLGGRITVESVPGQGATFLVTMPGGGGGN